MKTSLCFYPNPQKKSAKTGKVPIYVRVILNARKSEGRLYQAELTDKDLLLWDQRTMRLQDAKHHANKLINTLQKKFDDFIWLHGKNLHRYSASSIRDVLLGRNKEDVPTALVYIENYYSKSVHQNRELSKGTKKNYRKAINHFSSFLNVKKKSELQLLDVTSALAREFKDYLLCASDDGKKKGMKEPSAAGNIMKFKTIFKRAVDDGLLEKNPFQGIKLKATSPQKPRLTIGQVRALYELDLSKYPRLIPYRDLFLFSCFTGLAYEDAHNLRYSDLIPIGKTDTKIYLLREKTDVLTEVVLVSHAKQLVNKYNKEIENQITGRVPSRRPAGSLLQGPAGDHRNISGLESKTSINGNHSCRQAPLFMDRANSRQERSVSASPIVSHRALLFSKITMHISPTALFRPFLRLHLGYKIMGNVLSAGMLAMWNKYR